MLLQNRKGRDWYGHFTDPSVRSKLVRGLASETKELYNHPSLASPAQLFFFGVGGRREGEEKWSGIFSINYLCHLPQLKLLPNHIAPFSQVKKY